MGCTVMISEWEKIAEKDRLDVYKNIRNIDTIDRFTCPLCKEIVLKYSEIENLKNKGPNGIKKLKDSYEYLISISDYSSVYYFDIFNRLEEIQKEIDDYSNHYDENRFYKYKCEKENKNCYLIIYHYPKNEFFQINKENFTLKDKRYEYSQWKNNENLKKTLLEEREKLIFNQIMVKIHELLREEWKEITFANEYDEYLDATKNVKQKIEHEKLMRLDYGNEKNLTYIYDINSENLKYMETKKKLCQYIVQFAINEEEKS